MIVVMRVLVASIAIQSLSGVRRRVDSSGRERLHDSLVLPYKTVAHEPHSGRRGRHCGFARRTRCRVGADADAPRRDIVAQSEPLLFGGREPTPL